MPEQVVDLLETVEIKTEHGKTLAGRESGVDFLVQLHVEARTVRQSGERIMVREETDVLLGLLARPQVPHGDRMLLLAGELDRTQDELDRND